MRSRRSHSHRPLICLLLFYIIILPSCAPLNCQRHHLHASSPTLPSLISKKGTRRSTIPNTRAYEIINEEDGRCAYITQIQGAVEGIECWVKYFRVRFNLGETQLKPPKLAFRRTGVLLCAQIIESEFKLHLI